MEQRIESIKALERYVKSDSRRQYEVNSDRKKGIMRFLPKLSGKQNQVKERKTKSNKIKILPFKIISRQKGEKFYSLRIFSPKKIYSNLEYLIEWNETGKREYITKSELKRLTEKKK